MDSRDGKKKKESIDDILSDLNGLLNKMPSILDGIKMPEPQPEEKVQPPAPAPARGVDLPASADADKTVVLPAFSGLPEGSAEPAAEPAVPAADADKTIILEHFAGLPEGASAPQPAKDALVPQSLGDFMFGTDAEPGEVKPPAEPSSAPLEPAAELPAQEAEPQRPGPEAVFPGLPAEPVESLDLAPLGLPPADVPAKQYDTTRDFGIPDIDALLQLSDQPSAAAAEEQAMPEQAAAQEQAASSEPLEQASLSPAAEPGETVPTGDDLAEFEKQIAAAAPQEGGNVENDKPEEEKTDSPLSEEVLPAAGVELPAAPEAQQPTGFEAFTIEPSSLDLAPAQEPGAEVSREPSPEPAAEAAAEVSPEAAQLEPQFGQPGGAEISLGAQPDQAGETLQVAPPAEPVIETGAGISPEPQPEPQPAGGIELTVGNPAENTQQFAPAEPAASPGLELEPASAMFSSQPQAAVPQLSGDETLVVAPPPAASGDEEKTVIFEAGAMPGTTSRSQAGDLAGLAGRPVPEGIPAERVRAIVFLYSPEDKALCATVLSELDAICLKSASKPMFIKRSSVRECEPDLNANVALQLVQDAGANGLLCVGNVPQEKIYELENTFSGAGVFFRHYDAAAFTHSSALDLVADLILR